MQTTPTTKYFDVPRANVAWLMSKITDMNKRATKLGCDAVFVEETTPPTPQQYRNRDGDLVETMVHHIGITGAMPVLAGWRLIAILDHDSAARNIVRTVPGQEIDRSMYGLAPWCDHCRTERQRKQTYIVGHADGSTKQVGSTCLQDFLGGADPVLFGAMAQYIGDVFGAAEEAEEWESDLGGGGYYCYRLQEYLSWAALAVRLSGYKKSADMSPTWSTALMIWNNYIKRRSSLTPDVDDQDLATKALAWIAGIDPDTTESAYMRNLAIICKEEYVDHRNLGFAASLVPTYQREMGKRLERGTSKFVGKPGERRQFADMVVVRAIPTEGWYGLKTICVFQDPDGNHIVWPATGEIDVHQGEKVSFQATIHKDPTRAHSLYNGVAQTTVQRVKFAN